MSEQVKRLVLATNREGKYAYVEHPEGDVVTYEDYARLEAENERLRCGCNPTCPGCGLKPCNERGDAVLWCDECVVELQAELTQLRAEKERLEEAGTGLLRQADYIVGLIMEVGISTSWDDGDETDRVYAYHEIEPLEAAALVMRNELTRLRGTEQT